MKPMLVTNTLLQTKRLKQICITLLASLLAVLSLQSNFANAEEITSDVPAIISEEQILHTDLVLLALKADDFNHRCRGISVNQNFNKVNRLFITKYSLTANNYIKLYIEQDVRDYKQALKIEFKKELNRVGGCNAAIDQGWRNNINELYRTLFLKAEQSVWFPS